MIKVIKVKKGELAILFKNGQIQQVLSPGIHRFLDLCRNLSFQLIDLATPKVTAKTAYLLVSFYPDILAKHCTVVALEKNEIAFRYEDQKIIEVLLPQTKNVF